jgi:hypothetical protein
MGKQFKAVPLYIKNKKAGEITETSVKFMTNGEQVTGFDAVLGETTGIVTCEGSFSEAMVATGNDIDVIALLLAQGYADLGLLIGGKTYKVEAKFIDGEVKSTSKSGKVDGSFNWRSGAPQVI